MNVIFSAEAQRDYDTFWDEAHERYPLMATEIIARLHESIRHITSFPLATAIVEPPLRWFPDLRFFSVPRAGSRVLYFEVEPEGIRIVRILHSAMDHRAHLGG